MANTNRIPSRLSDRSEDTTDTNISDYRCLKNMRMAHNFPIFSKRWASNLILNNFWDTLLGSECTDIVNKSKKSNKVIANVNKVKFLLYWRFALGYFYNHDIYFIISLVWCLMSYVCFGNKGFRQYISHNELCNYPCKMHFLVLKNLRSHT